MYKPSKQTENTFIQLKEKGAWSITSKIFTKYQQKWHGPNIPVYIFPIANRQNLFQQTSNQKSGVSFHDKLFLFLTPTLSYKEIEALFVHEYHHVCRMKNTEKALENYTLLDSIILEGLAEAAVLDNCGPDYLAKWCRLYPDTKIKTFWERYLVKNLTIKKDDSQHDRLLFGGKGIPNMLGYAAGYTIVEKYKKSRNLTEPASFTIEAKDFLEIAFLN